MVTPSRALDPAHTSLWAQTVFFPIQHPVMSSVASLRSVIAWYLYHENHQSLQIKDTFFFFWEPVVKHLPEHLYPKTDWSWGYKSLTTLPHFSKLRAALHIPELPVRPGWGWTPSKTASFLCCTPLSPPYPVSFSPLYIQNCAKIIAPLAEKSYVRICF